MTNALIVGISGNMGSLIYKNAKDYGFNVVCGVDLNLNGNFDCPVYKTFDEIKENVEIVIDFSTPKVLTDTARFALANKTKLFYGVTGLSKSDENLLKNLSKDLAVFLSYNTSPYVNLMLNLVSAIAKFGFSSADILETHHRNKKDAPSGTAIAIKNAITPYAIDENSVTTHSIRGGNVVGTHKAVFFSGDEILSVTHTALSKETFAVNALKECVFLSKKQRGFFTIEDFMNETLKIN